MGFSFSSCVFLKSTQRVTRQQNRLRLAGPSPYQYSQVGSLDEAEAEREEEKELVCDFFPLFGEEGFPSQGFLGTIQDYGEGDFEVVTTVDNLGNPAIAVGIATLVNYTTLTNSSTHYPLNESFTVSFRTLLPEDGSETYEGYFTNGRATGGEGYEVDIPGYAVARWESRFVFIFFVEEGFAFFLVDAPFSPEKLDGGWHDVTIIYDGSEYTAGADWAQSSVSFYLDGEALTIGDFTGSVESYPENPATVVSSATPLLGYEPIASESGALGPTISEFCIRGGRDLSQVRLAVQRVLSSGLE